MALRVAGHTYSFRELPLDLALDRLAALGFRSVEMWLGHVDRVDEARHAVVERGLDVVAVGAGGFYEVNDDPRRAFEVARALGARRVVACVVPRLAPSVAAHADADVSLCLENHWDQRLAVPVEVRRALASVENTSACLDTGHALLAGVAPEVFVRELGTRLGHVHLKDGRRPAARERLLGRRARRRLLPRPAPVYPGAGDLDLAQLRRALADVAYDGVVTLEYEGDNAVAALGELHRRWASAESF